MTFLSEKIEFIVRYFKILLISFLLAFSSLSAQSLKNLELVTGEWPPYSTSRVEGYGLITELVKAALQDMGYNPAFSFSPFFIAYELARKGTVTAAFPFFKNDQRLKEMYYSDPLFEVNNVIFYNKNVNPTFSGIKSISELKNYRVGFVRSYSYSEEIMNAAMNSVEVKTEVTAFKLLMEGKIDLLPASEAVGQAIVDRHFDMVKHYLGILPSIKYKETVHLIASKRVAANRSFMNQFNESLKTIKDAGIYQEIIDKNLSGASASRLVRLQNPGSFPMIIARENPDDDEIFVLPRGTRAVVLEWSPHFLIKGDTKMYDEMFKKSKVRIVEGPLKGRVLYVENMYIEIE